jgi:hypothetical protein
MTVLIRAIYESSFNDHNPFLLPNNNILQWNSCRFSGFESLLDVSSLLRFKAPTIQQYLVFIYGIPMMEHFIKYHYSNAPNIYVFNFIMTLDTFLMYLKDNYVQLNMEIELYGYTKQSVTNECPRCVSNSMMLESDISHLDDCCYFLQTVGHSRNNTLRSFNQDILPTHLTQFQQNQCSNHGSTLVREIQQMYDSPPQQKPILSCIQESLYMLLPFQNSLTNEPEIFYQWCTMQETIEV